MDDQDNQFLIDIIYFFLWRPLGMKSHEGSISDWWGWVLKYGISQPEWNSAVLREEVVKVNFKYFVNLIMHSYYY